MSTHPTPTPTPGPSASVNLLTLVELTEPPYSLGRSAGHLARKARDGRLHAHRPQEGPGVPYKVPEAVVWSFARGDLPEDQQRACPLCGTTTLRRGRRR